MKCFPFSVNVIHLELPIDTRSIPLSYHRKWLTAHTFYSHTQWHNLHSERCFTLMLKLKTLSDSRVLNKKTFKFYALTNENLFVNMWMHTHQVFLIVKTSLSIVFFLFPAKRWNYLLVFSYRFFSILKINKNEKAFILFFKYLLTNTLLAINKKVKHLFYFF